MKPPGLAYTEVRASADLVTVVDRPDIPASVLFESIGFRPGLEGSIGGERDFGTKHRYAAMPTLPSNMKIVDGYNIYDKTTGTTYDIVVALDTSSLMHVYVNDTTLGPNNPGIANNWIEVTRMFGALVDDASIGATDTTVGVDTMTDSLGATVSWATNEVRYWIVVNTTRSKVCFVTASTSNSITCDAILGSSGLGFQNNDDLDFYQCNGVYQGYVENNGAVPHIRWNNVEAQVRALLYYGSAASVDASPTMRKPLALERESSARNYFYYGASTALLTLPANWYAELGGGGLIPAFETVGTIASPKGTNLRSAITGTVTVTPGTTVTGTGTAFTSELEVGQYIFITTSNNNDQAKRIATINSDTVLTVETAYVGTGAIQTCYAYEVQAAEIEDTSGIDWLKLSAFIAADATSITTNYRGLLMYATVMYDSDAQESDPVWALAADGDQRYVPVSIIARINFARMSKRISGLRFYHCIVEYSASGGFGAAAILKSASDYKLIYELPFHSLPTSGTVWSKLNRGYSGEAEGTESSGYIYKAIVPDLTYSFVNTKLAAAPSNIYSNIQHAVDTARSYLTPRFGINTMRAGSGIVVADESDSMLRVCNINGAAIIETDNFPDVTVDNAGSRLKIPLLSRGELIGLEVTNDKIVAIKRMEIETIDLQSGLQTIISVDTVARRGIISTPGGLFLPGRNGINLLPITGGPPLIANPLWSNRYNGTERTTDNANSRISDSARLAIVAGYNPIYKDVWFHITTLDADGTSRNLSYRYFLEDNRWFAREVGCGTSNAVNFFITRKDNTFSIGFGHSTTGSDNGILKYPNLDTGANYTNDTVSNYEDSVSSADASASKGITTKLLISIGNLYNLVQNAVLYELLIDSLGVMKAATSGTYNIKIYANNEFPTTFDSKTQAYDSKPSPRKITPRGLLERVLIELSLGTSNLSNYKQFLISSLYVGAVTQKRVGNR